MHTPEINTGPAPATLPWPRSWYLYALGGVAVARLAVSLLAGF